MSEKKTGGITAFAIDNPHFIIVCCLLVAILGGLALARLPKDLLPAGNQPAVQVISFYNGMPVENVAQDLTRRFELYTGQAIGIERQESKSIVGVSIVRNYFGSGISLDSAVAQTVSTVMSVLRRLPPGTQPPLILPFDPMAAVPLALVAVGGDFPQKQLYDVARYQVRNVIQAVPGAVAPTVMGGAMREAIAYVDPAKLREFELSPVTVASRLQQLNTFVPAGDVKLGKFDYQILSNGMADRVEDMNEFPLRAINGVTVRLKDVGRAEDAQQIQTNVVSIDGRPEVYVPIYRQPGANSLAVVDQVRLALEELHKRYGDYTFSLIADQTSFIRHAIASITEETAIGGGLAVLLVFLFLGNPTATFGVMLSLPLSILAAFLGLAAAGHTINAMTLGGLALSIGVLVDNSIVVVENISTKLETGLDSARAALEGGSEVAMPVLSSTLATLIVFFPVLFLQGIIRTLFWALALTVIFAMAGSYFSAMTVMPLFASRYLRPVHPDSLPRLLAFLQGLVTRLTESYGRALRQALRYRKAVLAGVFAALAAAALLLLPKVGTELFPKADAGSFTMLVRLPSGTRIERTQAFAEELEAKLRGWIPPSDLAMVVSNAGVYYGFPAAYTPNSGPQDLFFVVELSERRARSSQFYAGLLRRRLREAYPDIETGFQLGGLLSAALNGGLPSPIDVQIAGPDAKTAASIARALVPKIRALPGAADVRLQQRFDAPVIKLDFDRKKAASMGLTPDELIKDVLSAVAGSAAFNPQIWVDPRSGIDYFLGVQFQESSVKSLADLAAIPVRGPLQNRSVPLGRIAQITQTTGPIEIEHVNLDPVADIYLDAYRRDIGGLAADIQRILDGASMPTGYRASVRGEVSAMKRAAGSLGGGFVLAAVLVYLVLVVQFRSFVRPAIIMTAVPLGMVGIVAMLALTGTYFSIQAAIGAVFMIGIAVANGVLLIEFIMHHHSTGAHVNDAIIRGSKARLRPILMTSLASVVGLAPMAIGYGHGSEANIPLGRAVIGGQLLSVTLTLFVVPLLYRLLDSQEDSDEPAGIDFHSFGGRRP